VPFFVSLALIAAPDSAFHGLQLVNAGDVALGGGSHGLFVGPFSVETGKSCRSIEGPLTGFEIRHAVGLFGRPVGRFDERAGRVSGHIEVGAELARGGRGLTPVATEQLAEKVYLPGAMAADFLLFTADLADQLPG